MKSVTMKIFYLNSLIYNCFAASKSFYVNKKKWSKLESEYKSIERKHKEKKTKRLIP